eukprot:gnl/TRDRNA2_/TRDRNA2_35337_c0_seq1.p1 gnl/TRDRNA2_/TRDRNA2_35337_c0~~gnl/TRDRNA2_/TRDRNA2_35337_c0_seq1.p1  ORF type:complete len:298 (-),score=60.99 gnl/TRDRNA2_/TRDRNA2_35337_c0_seq1:87-932(-)
MGGDGGVVPSRCDRVKTKGWGFTKGSSGRYTNSLGEMSNYQQMVSEDTGQTYFERQRQRMSCCWLTQQPLKEPVVACKLGNLYNKESMIAALLEKNIPEDISHVRALKDLKQVHITWGKAETEGAGDASGRVDRRIVCPVSRDDLDTGGAKAIVIWSTGTIMSLKSLKALKMKECPITSKEFDPVADVVTLAPDDAELASMREALPPPPQKKRKAAATEEDAGASAKKAAKASGNASSEKGSSWDSLFIKKGVKHAQTGLDGTRDAFGTPCYNRGAHMGRG